MSAFKSAPATAFGRQFGIVLEMGLLLCVLVLFNAAPEYVGVVTLDEAPRRFVPLLAPAFFVYLPLLNIYWGLRLGLLGYRLAADHAPHWFGWAELALIVFNISILARMAAGPPILGVNPALVPPELLGDIASIPDPVHGSLALVARVIVIGALIGTAVDGLRKLVQLVTVSADPPLKPVA